MSVGEAIVENGPNMQLASLLEESAAVHGHLCAGQVLGVRMSLLGLRKIGISDPKGRERKRLIVFVEMDRCATDAIQSVTGCSLGKRSMKFMDYGKMAATFLDVMTGKAVRIVAREDSRRKAKERFPESEDAYAGQTEAYTIMPDEELFEVMDVTVTVAPGDMPGRPTRRVQCDSCGEYVQDGRDVRRDGRMLCAPCAGSGYYELRFPPCSSVSASSGAKAEGEGRTLFGPALCENSITGGRSLEGPDREGGPQDLPASGPPCPGEVIPPSLSHVIIPRLTISPFAIELMLPSFQSHASVTSVAAPLAFFI